MRLILGQVRHIGKLEIVIYVLMIAQKSGKTEPTGIERKRVLTLNAGKCQTNEDQRTIPNSCTY
jgi:hypothetical protein